LEQAAQGVEEGLSSVLKTEVRAEAVVVVLA
jgi:hypothetical protein